MARGRRHVSCGFLEVCVGLDGVPKVVLQVCCPF